MPETRANLRLKGQNRQSHLFINQLSQRSTEMNSKQKKVVERPKAAEREAHARERSAFRTLLLTNPNYFGNLAESPVAAVSAISGNTYYEELACVGYQPQQRRLAGVVYLYQPSGYGTDICGPGTTEYVRFYLSSDNGATWKDQGMTSFQAFNVPEGTEGEKRLEYAVTLPAEVTSRFCFFNPLVRVRAILSWNNPPPANQPNWVPVWGNVREATIQLEPFRFLPWPELFEIGKIKLPSSLAEVLDLETPIATKKKTLGAVELAALYRDKGVPVHRFAFKEIQSFTESQVTLTAEAFSAALPGISLEPGIIDQLLPKSDGNTSFEELKCIGLDPNTPDTLVGVLQIKKPNGYSGGPCTSGSPEYVTFWADFDGNGTFESCLGTASVQVYDLSSIPPEGIHYAVRLPIDLERHRQACRRGPKVVRVRAILSWNVAAPCANPDHVPVWGNRLETVIHIAPSAQAPAGKIAILGGIPVLHIDDATGLTTNSAIFATNNLPPDTLGRPCPFARRVTVQGVPVMGHSYVVEVSQDGVVWTPVLTDLQVTDQNGNTSVHKANPVTNRFNYLPFTQNVNSLLAQWDTTGDAKWHVRLSVYDAGGTLQGSDTHVIQLDNTGPEASMAITTGTGNCGKFASATVLSGNFTARDTYLGRYRLEVLPAVNPPGVGVPVPNSGISNTAPAPGDSWTLDTKDMQACGYVIRVVAVDRAIINSQSVGHTGSASAGFCLEVAAEAETADE
jgi:hypothetical protein